MQVKKFEEKYGTKGGIQKLTELRSLFFTQDYIAKQFGVSKERVRQWMLEFFGSRYDPRPDREEAVIANMIEFARNNPLEEFNSAFRGTEYYKKVLAECNNLEIYGIK